ncbi:MAG: CoA transferase [Candidatus Entotheonellia bacterium]
MPLEDVKVLDLSHALAGPFCSTMLGDFGAQVIKLEVPGSSMGFRWAPSIASIRSSTIHKSRLGR